MNAYVDSSALLKLYLDEPDSERAVDILAAFRGWITGRHTVIEVRRALRRALDDRAHPTALQAFGDHWPRMHVVELGAPTCERAATLAEQTGARTMDALHLAAADLAGGGLLPFVTFDRRLADTARGLGWEVLGA